MDLLAGLAVILLATAITWFFKWMIVRTSLDKAEPADRPEILEKLGSMWQSGMPTAPFNWNWGKPRQDDQVNQGSPQLEPGSSEDDDGATDDGEGAENR